MKLLHAFAFLCLFGLVAAPGFAQQARIDQDLRLSPVGTEGHTEADAFSPEVVYHAPRDAFFVVWASDARVDGKLELHGRLIGAQGTPLGDARRLVSLGAEDDPTADAFAPKVVYNATDDEYLVAWQGTAAPSRVPALFARRFDADGLPLGDAMIRLSEAPARHAALAYDAERNAYLVVWESHRAGERPAIFARSLDATGQLLDTEPLRLSAPEAPAFRPALALDPARDAFLVVWESPSDGPSTLIARFVDARTAQPVAAPFPLEGIVGAHRPTVALDAARGVYFVGWVGTETSEVSAPGLAIYGQRLDAATGRLLGERLALSATARTGQHPLAATAPRLAFDAEADAFVVVWQGHHAPDGQRVGAHEIFGRRIPAEGTAPFDDAPRRLSDMGTDDADDRFDATQPALALGHGLALTVWTGDDDEQGRDNVQDIFGRLFALDAPSDALVADVPGGFLLSDAYPNPFNPTTTFTLTLNAPEVVELVVFDMLGRAVATLFRGTVAAHRVQPFTFEASGLPSGTYFIRATGPSFSATKQVLLLK